LLIVEDHDDTAHVLSSGLKELGYEVAIAHNGPLALQLAQSFSPDVAMVDIGLPVMDGWELAKRLLSRVDGLHIIAVTGMVDDLDRQRSLDVGISAHLTKPVDFETIHATLQRLPISPKGRPPE
jgi:CheY-like chemotaxis protein